MKARIEAMKEFLATAPWRLWMRQLKTVLRIELKKNFFTARGTWIYLLAFAPTIIIAIHALQSSRGYRSSMEEDTQVLAAIFQVYYLRLGIFFGCLGIFTWLFRGEIVEKSLHYYFLAPMRRELLVLGKFLAGAVTATFFFGLAVLISFWLLYAQFGAAGRAFVFDGPGLGHLQAYLGITALACIGYGALFLALSLIFKNPGMTAALVLIWEMIHPFMPSLLQKLSVTFYLKQLCPVAIPASGLAALFTVVTEPVSPWLAVPGLLCLSAVILVFACWRIRRLEISYVAE